MIFAREPLPRHARVEGRYIAAAPVEPADGTDLMNDDRHGEPCAREVGARVDAHAGVHGRKANRAGAARRENEPPPTSDWSVYRTRLLRAFFRDAGGLAARYRVSGHDVVEHARRLCKPQLERGTLLKPVRCVGDLAVATACVLGRANAWNELWVFAEPSMTRAAFSRLPESPALTWTRRYWTQLEQASRAGGPRGLARYDGARPIRLWIVEDLLGTLEAERTAGRLEIRREHLGRPLPLRLVGELLA